MLPRLRTATKLDLPRIHEVRQGTAENRLEDPSLVTPAEVERYLDEAIFLVSEDDAGIQGFACANHQTGYVWALFVIDGAQRRGHGGARLHETIDRLRRAGHRQAFLTTGTKYKSCGLLPFEGVDANRRRHARRSGFSALALGTTGACTKMRV
jgi:GNAT superfamily N-acetyltransferase